MVIQSQTTGSWKGKVTVATKVQNYYTAVFPLDSFGAADWVGTSVWTLRCESTLSLLINSSVTDWQTGDWLAILCLIDSSVRWSRPPVSAGGRGQSLMYCWTMLVTCLSVPDWWNIWIVTLTGASSRTKQVSQLPIINWCLISWSPCKHFSKAEWIWPVSLMVFQWCYWCVWLPSAPPRPLLQLCRLQILQLVGPRHLKRLPLPGGLIRFLKHQEGLVDSSWTKTDLICPVYVLLPFHWLIWFSKGRVLIIIIDYNGFSPNCHTMEIWKDWMNPHLVYSSLPPENLISICMYV